jgi:hypothetical protein
VPLLQVLIDHINRLYTSSEGEVGTSTYAISSDYKELCDQFSQALLLPTSDRPLVIFLDSLDQLSVMNNSRKLGFLPSMLTNPAVRIILSTLPDPEYEVWNRLITLYPPNGPAAVVVPPWTSSDGETVLNAIMASQHFSLLPYQREIVLNKFSQCPTCLFLVLSTFIAREWTSTMLKSSCYLADNVSDCICQV